MTDEMENAYLLTKKILKICDLKKIKEITDKKYYDSKSKKEDDEILQQVKLFKNIIYVKIKNISDYDCENLLYHIKRYNTIGNIYYTNEFEKIEKDDRSKIIFEICDRYDRLRLEFKTNKLDINTFFRCLKKYNVEDEEIINEIENKNKEEELRILKYKHDREYEQLKKKQQKERLDIIKKYAITY